MCTRPGLVGWPTRIGSASVARSSPSAVNRGSCRKREWVAARRPRRSAVVAAIRAAPRVCAKPEVPALARASHSVKRIPSKYSNSIAATVDAIEITKGDDDVRPIFCNAGALVLSSQSPLYPPRPEACGHCLGADTVPVIAASNRRQGANCKSRRPYQGNPLWEAMRQAQEAKTATTAMLANPKVCNNRSAVQAPGVPSQLADGPVEATFRAASFGLYVAKASARAVARENNTRPTISTALRRR